MSDSRTVLPAPKLLNLTGVRVTESAITLVAGTSSRVALCPACGKRSSRVHSRYTRTLADLPWQGIPVSLRLSARRFFCDEGPCERAIFAERLPGVAACYGRRTERLDEWFTHVAFALGGEAGSRLLKDLGVVVSGDTLLKHIRSMRLSGFETPRVLSVDDFAFRRGTRYGTILVDLERHALVDILPDRSADTFARWLSEHPGVEVVSRDRGGEYAEAARRTAPGAAQVADRFHLLKNLRDAVSRVFRQHADVLDLVPTPAVHLQTLTNLRLDREASKKRTREQTHKLFDSIHALSKRGIKNAQIARELEIHATLWRSTWPSRPRQRDGISSRRLAPLRPTKITFWGAGNKAAITRHRSTKRSPSRATPVPTRTSGASLATSRNESA
jgi:transposase